MGRGSTHRFGEMSIKTSHTPRRGWQGWVIEDGCQVHHVARKPSEAAAVAACHAWIKTKKTRGAA